MALATVTATLNGKQNGGKIKAIISDTNLGNYQGLRTASVLRFCVWCTQLLSSDAKQFRASRAETDVCRHVRQELVEQVQLLSNFHHAAEILLAYVLSFIGFFFFFFSIIVHPVH